MTFSVIAVSFPDFFIQESGLITRLLISGAVDRVHLRKPGASESDMSVLISGVPEHLRHRLSLHDCHGIAAEFGCGVHLNSRCPDVPEGFTGTVSRSCHSAEELSRYPGDDYHFLSPVYPSISKPGYEPQRPFDSALISADGRTVALGGVTPEKFPELKALGFNGAAMLGCVWEAARSEEGLSELIDRIRCFNS